MYVKCEMHPPPPRIRPSHCLILRIMEPCYISWTMHQQFSCSILECCNACLRNRLPVGDGCVYVLQMFFLFFSVRQKYETAVLGNS